MHVLVSHPQAEHGQMKALVDASEVAWLELCPRFARFKTKDYLLNPVATGKKRFDLVTVIVAT